MYSEDLVSIITPAYNCASTISETIESVLHQTYKTWEMLIVDDCSADTTSEIISNYAKCDSRIVLIKLAKNSGSAYARNTGIAQAKGRYIAFLDSDDLWKRNKLEKQIQFMNGRNYAFTFTGYETFSSSVETRRRVFRMPQSVNYKQYLGNSIIGNLTVIMDRKLMGEVHVESGSLEDVLTWMYYLRDGWIAYGLDENLASYRVLSQSKSGNKIKNAQRFFHCLHDVQKLPFYQCIYYEASYIFNALYKRMLGEIVEYKGEDVL